MSDRIKKRGETVMKRRLQWGAGVQSVRSLLKVAIICHFKGIDVQVRILMLKRAKMPFSA
jgi:hypothetical protein